MVSMEKKWAYFFVELNMEKYGIWACLFEIWSSELSPPCMGTAPGCMLNLYCHYTRGCGGLTANFAEFKHQIKRCYMSYHTPKSLISKNIHRHEKVPTMEPNSVASRCERLPQYFLMLSKCRWRWTEKKPESCPRHVFATDNHEHSINVAFWYLPLKTSYVISFCNFFGNKMCRV